MSLPLFALIAAATFAPQAATPIILPKAPPPPIISVTPRLSKLSEPALAMARALADEIKAQLWDDEKRTSDQQGDAERRFRDALRASTPDFAALSVAAKAYDEARGLPQPFNERWVELAKTLAPADQAVLLRALPTFSGQLIVPTTFSPPVPVAKSPAQVASDAVKKAAFDKLDAAFRADEPARKARQARIEAARSAMLDVLKDTTSGTDEMAAAMNRAVDAQTSNSRAQAQILAKVLGSMTPAEREAMSAGIGISAMIAIGPR